MHLVTYKNFSLQLCDIGGDWLTRLCDGEGRSTTWRGPYPSRHQAAYAARRYADRLARSAAPRDVAA